MTLEGQCVVITGAANGIGRAMAERFAREGVKALGLFDVDAEGVHALADATMGAAYTVDVSDEMAYRSALKDFADRFGPVDVLCSNAGVALGGGPEVPNGDFEKSWQVNVMSHVYGARAVLPAMLAKGSGYLVQTVSAAGLLNNIAALPYAMTKHAAMGLAEWLQITYGKKGLKVSCVCPQGVETRMLDAAGGLRTMLGKDAISAEKVADAVVEGLKDERFLILPHPQVGDYVKFKAQNYDMWLHNMQGLQSHFGLDPSWPPAEANDH